jgi:hypothetical protein
LIFSGSSDGVTPPADHHIPIYQGLTSTCKSFVSITGGAHCYYANTNFNCDFGESTSSQNVSITRTEQQTAMYSVLDPWLDFKLKGICDAYGAFLLAIQSSPGTINETSCPSLQTVSISANGMLLNATASGNPVSYQWYLDGNAINGATSSTYEATQEGVYHVIATYDYGCTVSNNQTLGSFEENILNVKIYPNPANEVLFIQMKEEKVSVKVLDINGRLINQKIEGCSLHTIDISNLKKGIYLVEITDGANSFTKRFIKE